MRHTCTATLLLLLLILAVAPRAMSQSYQLINRDTLYVSNCHGDPISITYLAPTDRDTLDMCLILETDGTPFSIDINLFQGYAVNPVELKLWDGDSATGTLLLASSQQFVNQQLIYVSSGRLTARLHRDDTTTLSLTFSLNWSNPQNFTSPCINTAQNFRVTDLTHHSAVLEWNSSSNSATITCNGTSIPVLGHDCYLTNLEPDSEYTVTLLPASDASRPCCARALTFRTGCTPAIGCPDFTDLQADYVRGYHGEFANPYKHIGIVDSGSNSYTSHHTVHTDHTETDPRTGGQLLTVCPGTNATVRLGNCSWGAEAEAIEYFLSIDTNLYALLLLHYAVVLQNPGHTPVAQPRFTMQILDNTGAVIDPICGAADFAASASLGWNQYEQEQTVWKDWTTIGFDMTPYHGQTVRVRFTTFDCSGGLHYGYAYFNAECLLNSATTEYCGDSDTNSMTAPDGFNYLWYYDNPSNPVSTEQTVHFSNSDDLLHCRLISKENPACYVTLNTYAGHRWPKAAIDTLKTESLGCDGYRVYFVNRSVITTDDGDTVELHCESAHWSFGDNYGSYNYSPSHIYTDSGDYTVTLVSGIANNSCTDTTQFTIHIPDYYVPAFKDTFACDTFWIDGTAFTHDTLGPQYRVHHVGDCDTLYTLDLHILPPSRFELPPDTFCYSNTYHWRGQTAGSPNITDTTYYSLVDHYTAANGCDSAVILNLMQLPPDRISFEYEADCENKKYYLTAVSDLPYLHWSSSPFDTCLVGHENDRQLFVSPQTVTSYSLTSDSRDSVYCPTTSILTLAPVSFPSAQLVVNPTILSYTQPDFVAHDANRGNSVHQWSLQLFPDTDTLLLSETSGQLYYQLESFDLDSVRVILTAGNTACLDTVSQVLPFAKVAVWAANVFTPSEETNNRFAPVATGLLETELFIYDRAGRLIYSTQDLTQGWDGTCGGHPCPQASYIWLLRYRAADHPDIWQSTSGIVTLLH